MALWSLPGYSSDLLVHPGLSKWPFSDSWLHPEQSCLGRLLESPGLARLLDASGLRSVRTRPCLGRLLEFLSLKSIAETRSPRNSEAACLRLGIALSEAAGVAEMGAEALQYHADKQLGNLGLDELVDFMASEAGQQYVAAAKALNKTNNALENEEEVKAAVDGWVGSLNALLEHQKSIRKLAQVSARLYLWSMDSLEQLALLKYPAAVLEHVAVDNPALELKAVKALVENPRVSALRAAFVASYTKAIFGQGQKKARKCNLAASSPEAAASSSTGTEKSGSATSSEESRSKKKKSKKDKKGKKQTKKATKDKKSKRKKDKDKKKRAKSGSCSNSKATSSEENQKEKQTKKDKKDGPAPLPGASQSVQ